MRMSFLVISTTSLLWIASLPAGEHATGPEHTDDLNLPAAVTTQLLTGAIFSESSTEHVGGEDPDEKEAIGWAFVNMAHYAGIEEEGKRTCYNASFGDGTILSAIEKGSRAFESPAWKRVMDGQRLKPKEALLKLQPGDLTHLKLSIAAANAIGDMPTGPKSVAKLGGVPIQFNRAADSPPNPARQKKLGKIARHTFYGFKPGRECQ